MHPKSWHHQTKAKEKVYTNLDTSPLALAEVQVLECLHLVSVVLIPDHIFRQLTSSGAGGGGEEGGRGVNMFCMKQMIDHSGTDAMRGRLGGCGRGDEHINVLHVNVVELK